MTTPIIFRCAEEGGYEKDDYFRAYCTRGDSPDHNTEDAPVFIEKSFYDKAQLQISDLKKIIAKEVSENDEFGSEFVIAQILRGQLAIAVEALEFYAGGNHVEFPSRKNSLTEPSIKDEGELASNALDEIKGNK